MKRAEINKIHKRIRIEIFFLEESLYQSNIDINLFISTTLRKREREKKNES